MRPLFWGAAALAFAGLPVWAADFPRYGSPAPYGATAPTPVHNWSGPYVGVNLGYLSGRVDRLPTSPSGIAGGAQAGYNWQTGQFVFGGEADIQVSGAEDTFAPYKFSNPWFGTVRGRVGYALSNVLFYGTAGVAFGRGRLEFAGLTEDQSHFGWAGGAGIELGLTPHWSAKAEYLFISLSDKTYVLSGTSSGIDSHLLRFGVNYHF